MYRRTLPLAVILCGSLLYASPAQATAPTADELDAAQRFAAARFTAAPVSDASAGRLFQVEPPFAFTYDDKSSREFLANWPRLHESRPLDDQRTAHTVTWTDPATGLVVRAEAIEYRDFPTVEWTLYFKNTGAADTPMLERIEPLEIGWEAAEPAGWLLHHNVGSPADGNDYAPRETPLTPGATKRLSAAGGRPTNSDLSYFNLERKGDGLIVVVGWPGQWAADFACAADGAMRMRAGQELTHFRLHPGEEVRTPLILVQFWKGGDWLRAQNVWRRWMMAHAMPRPGGKLPPPQFVASSSRAYAEMIGANEANQIMHIDRYLEERLKIDYWWMDAGWYVQEQGWPQVGTWEVDTRRFPHGLRPITDHAHAKGIKAIVWFEPERVMPGTRLYEEHPEWLLKAGPSAGDTMAGLCSWSSKELGGSDPCVTYNPTPSVRSFAQVRWEPGRLAFHPGAKGEYSVVRWTAPAAGEYRVRAKFLAIDEKTTTDVHVLARGEALFDGRINLQGQRKEASYAGEVALKPAETLDFVVGWGNGAHVCDSTGVEIAVEGPPGTVHDAAKAFDAEHNAAGVWSYGYLVPGVRPESETFQFYDRPAKGGETGPRLLNLGDPAARAWLTEHVSQLIREQGIDLYRQDFNIDPLAFWRAADAEDRQGITEIRYVTGYLAYWDELRRRFPTMLIDSCASGGRRNDLETMRRAVPLWRSDYAFEPIGHQSMTAGISLWLPYHGTGTVACTNAGYYGGGKTPVEPYAFWSNAAPSLGSGIDIRVRDIDYNALRRLVGQWRELSRYYYGDYYPLTRTSRDKNAWIAWQFDAPEEGAGVVQAFRRAESGEASVRLKLRRLEADATYRLTRFDVEGETTATGRELLGAGLTIEIGEQPGAAVIVYRREPR